MDLSSQQQHQYQSWQLQSQSYDPSAYNYHHQPYYYQQFPSGYGYTSNQSNANLPQQQHGLPIHPPGVSGPSPAGLSVQSQENVYQLPAQQGSTDPSVTATMTYPTPGFQQGHQWYPQPDAYGPVVGGPGLALGLGSQPYLLHPPASQAPWKFGNRRGGKPVRGGGQGKLLRGKGRNQGRGVSRMSSSSNTEPSANKNTNYSRKEPGPNLKREANSHGMLQASALTQKNVPRMARCEICNVDCTSLDVLEQHKLGKRHKKKLKNLSEVQKGNGVADESNQVTPLQTESLLQVEESKPSLLQNLPSETVEQQDAMESKDQKDESKNPDVPVEAKMNVQPMETGTNQFSDQTRKIGGGRGGKRMRMSKVVIPLVCDLCNVKCDTQEVLDCHLSGKKHLSKRKHFEAHQAMYGPLGLQAMYPPNPVAQTLLHSQGPQQAPLSAPQASEPSAAASLPPVTQDTVS